MYEQIGPEGCVERVHSTSGTNGWSELQRQRKAGRAPSCMRAKSRDRQENKVRGVSEVCAAVWRSDCEVAAVLEGGGIVGVKNSVHAAVT